jgi:hypothetical protein
MQANIRPQNQIAKITRNISFHNQILINKEIVNKSKISTKAVKRH